MGDFQTVHIWGLKKGQNKTFCVVKKSQIYLDKSYQISINVVYTRFQTFCKYKLCCRNFYFFPSWGWNCYKNRKENILYEYDTDMLEIPRFQTLAEMEILAHHLSSPTSQPRSLGGWEDDATIIFQSWAWIDAAVIYHFEGISICNTLWSKVWTSKGKRKDLAETWEKYLLL